MYTLSKTCQATGVDSRIYLNPVKPNIIKQMLGKLSIFIAYKAAGYKRVFFPI